MSAKITMNTVPARSLTNICINLLYKTNVGKLCTQSLQQAYPEFWSNTDKESLFRLWRETVHLYKMNNKYYKYPECRTRTINKMKKELHHEGKYTKSCI